MSTAHRSVTDRALMSLVSVAVGLIFLVVVGLMATAWYPAGPLTRLAIRVVNEPHVNGEIHIEVDYCKSRDTAPAEVRWSLLDGVSVMLPPYVVTLAEGCQVRVVSLPLSRNVAPGVYQLQVTGIYHLWPWREEVYIRRSPPFRSSPSASGGRSSGASRDVDTGEVVDRARRARRPDHRPPLHRHPVRRRRPRNR
jgi:hypothetical protein